MHHIDAPTSTFRRWHAPVFLAASVLAVLAIAFGIHNATGGSANNSNQAAGSTGQLTAMRWTLIGLHADHTVSIPHGYRGELEFDSAGHFHGLNGLNGIDGTYHAVGDRITMKLDVSGGVGYGANPAVSAMNSLYISNSNVSDNVTSTYMVTGSTLTVRTKQWTLTFAGSTATNNTPETSGSITHS